MAPLPSSAGAAEGAGHDERPRSEVAAKAIDARRETQRHLVCLARQIAARAGRPVITVRVRSRERGRSGSRLYRRELAVRVAFERGVELDTLARRLAWQQQVIDKLEPSGDAAFPPLAG